jgi:hypothetical protein
MSAFTGIMTGWGASMRISVEFTWSGKKTVYRVTAPADPVLVHGDRLNSALCVAGTDCGLGGRVHAALMQGVVLSEN